MMKQKTDKTYFENLVVRKSMFGHFSTLCMKRVNMGITYYSTYTPIPSRQCEYTN